jgi:hypothetical protein
MPGWIEGTNQWFDTSTDKKHITSSVEPAGLAFTGLMEDDEWNDWISRFKQIATDILGYKIGEIETGEVTHEPEWVNESLRVFADFIYFLQPRSPEKAWEFYELDKSELTELDEIEQEKILFRQSWHTLHDNLASGLQYRSHPQTASFLFKANVRFGSTWLILS